MLTNNLATAWQWMFSWGNSASRSDLDSRAAIHRYNPTDDFRGWASCRDRAQFHLGRARRAKDRGDYRTAAREIERALEYDDTSEAYFLVLGQCHLRGAPPDHAAARRVFERALAINPLNPYTMKLLLEAYQADGLERATQTTLERARAAGGARFGSLRPLRTTAQAGR
jgi:tetratricopeptide (TPR) repeat protein